MEKGWVFGRKLIQMLASVYQERPVYIKNIFIEAQTYLEIMLKSHSSLLHVIAQNSMILKIIS